jgi:hypothetical protein
MSGETREASTDTGFSASHEPYENKIWQHWSTLSQQCNHSQP